MTLEEIKDLFARVPSDAPYLRHAATSNSDIKSRQSAKVERYAHACNDPAFGWKFVRTFVDMNLPLPYDVLNDTLWQAYWFEAENQFNDNILEALALEDHRNRHAKNFLRAMLMIKDMDVTEMSERLGLSVETINIYGDLFFNVRDRMDDESYLAHIIYPEGRPIELHRNYLTSEDLGMLMMRAAWNVGLDPVLAVSGMRSNFLTEFDSQQNAKRFESLIMGNGQMWAKLGALNQHDMPGIMHARSVVTAIKSAGAEAGVDDDMQKGLGALSMAMGVLDTVKRIQQPDIKKRESLQSMIDSGVKE